MPALATDIYGFQDPDFLTGLGHRIAKTLSRGLCIVPDPVFFFRADDIGVPSRRFFRMMDLFVRFDIPLNLAVVPTWITRQRWESMSRYHTRYPELFCWYLHGWRHTNHESTGKKQEFGPARPPGEIQSELSRGSAVLKSVLKEQFSMFFTPPWNRCSIETMTSLSRMGFKGISRNQGSRPQPPEGLKDFAINVDLHTRKETAFETGWDHVFKDILQGVISGQCGIMLHHMRMNDMAFGFLEQLLEKVAEYKQIRTMTFDRMAQYF